VYSYTIDLFDYSLVLLLQRNLVVRIVTFYNLARSTGEVRGSLYFIQEQQSVLQELRQLQI